MSKININTSKWIKGKDYPIWMDEIGVSIISQGYLLPDENVFDAFKRVSKFAARRLKRKDLQPIFYEAIEKNWLCLASPVLSNMGTERGLPISCFGVDTDDSIEGIASANSELMRLTSQGGGVGIGVSRVRGRGKEIASNGISEGVVPWCKIYDSTILATNQGCYDDKTELLTNNGWKLFKDLNENDLVAQVDLKRNITFVKPTDFIEYFVNEELVRFKSGTGLDLLVTKNHNMVYESQYRVGGIKTNPKKWNGTFNKKEAEYYKPGRSNALHSAGIKDGECVFTYEDAFRVAYQADALKKINKTNRVLFRFKKQRKIERLTEILKALNLDYDLNLDTDGATKIYVNSVPNDLMHPTLEWVDLNKVDTNWCNKFIDELSEWDGSKGNNDTLVHYCSIIKSNIDIVQGVCVIANKRCKNRIQLRDGNRKTLYVCTITNYKKYSGDSIKKTYEPYEGNVYCVTVPTNMIVVRRDFGTAVICGNSVRRGAASVNLHVNHPDIEEFLMIRRPKGDVNRQCLNLHQCVVINDEFMEKVENKDPKSIKIWGEILKTRLETGEPYIMYEDNVNNANPIPYKKNNLLVSITNICSEIALHTDPLHSFICCLSSLNVSKWDEWKDYKFSNGMSLPELACWFLEGVLQEFIDRSKNLKFLENSYRSAVKGRAIGIGVLGWHTLLQEKMIPFIGIQANSLTRIISEFIQTEAIKASKEQALIYGEPEWCLGTGLRHTHLIAIAPTVSNANISGGVSPSIEPIPANVFNLKTHKGTFIKKNPTLEKLLASKGYNIDSIWEQILKDKGSVLGLPDYILTEEEKNVFLTFKEINPFEIVKQNGIRQKFVDQAISLNLTFDPNDSPKFISDVHKLAWKEGIKTLYYMRSESIIRGDNLQRTSECVSCEG